MEATHMENKKTIDRLLCVLLIFALLITISGCATKPANSTNGAAINAENSQREHALSYIDMPDDFGKIRTLAVFHGSNLLIAGSLKGVPTLYSFDSSSEVLTNLAFDSSAPDAKTIYGMTSDGSGGVWLLAGEKPAEYMLEGEIKTNAEFSGLYSIIHYNPSGEIVGNVSTETLGDFSPLGILADEDKHIVLWNTSEIIVLNLDGSKLFGLDTGGQKRIMAVAKLEGLILAHTDEGDKTGINYISMSSRNWGEYVADEEKCYENSFGGYTDCGGERFIINNGMEVFSYNKAEKKYDKILSWLECGVDGAEVVAFKELEAQKYVAAFKGDQRFAILQEKQGIPARQKLKIAVSFLSADLAALITQFNGSNEDYVIEPCFYETEADMTRLRTEIVAGKAPDMYDFTFMPMDGFVSSGELLDLNTFLKESGCELVAPIKSALEKEGKLHSLPNSFKILSFVASSEFVGDKTSCTTDEMNEIMKKCSTNMHRFGTFATKAELLKWVCTFSLVNFVDRSSGQCSFTDDEFIKLLNACNEMPKDPSQFGDIQVYEDNALLKIASVEGVVSLANYAKRFAGNYSFIGFPNDNGNGSLFSFNGPRLSISAQSVHSDEAWAFIQTMLSDSYQEKIESGIPILKSALDKQIDDAVKGKLTFYNGEKAVISQRDIDKFQALLSSTTTVDDIDIVARDIIIEEAQALFNGDKTAEAVAKIIQSRESIYFGEQR